MFHVAILGTNEISKFIKQIIDGPYKKMLNNHGLEPLSTAAFIKTSDVEDEIIDGVSAITIKQFLSFYKMGMIQAVVFPREVYRNVNWFLTDMLETGVNMEDIYITDRLRDGDYNADNVISFMKPYTSAPYLPYLEFHVADHCNLNCAACEHYSGLVHEEKFPVYSQFEKELLQLTHFISDIGVIRILGGEPLLNPEIIKYFVLTRRLYPDATIVLVTNALLLRNMSDEFYASVRENSILIHISYYLPLEKQMDKIEAFLQSKGVMWQISPLMKTFTMKQTLVKQPDAQRQYYNCYQAHCHNLYEGKLAACFLPFTTKYFNKEFNKQLPEDGAIDLFESGLTTEEVKTRLLTAFERCCYCTSPKEIPWEQIHTPSVLEDWVRE